MRIHVKPISPVQNRDFGKRKELEPGQVRVSTLRVDVVSSADAAKMSIADLAQPPAEATIEILWHDHPTIDKYKRWVREHPEHELVE